MKFNRGRRREEPEINFIPLVDMLLVILIFLMVTTTYSRFSELQITLPTAEGAAQDKKPLQLDIGIDRNGRYVINERQQSFQSVTQFADVLRAEAGKGDPVVVIYADAQSPHQAVVNVMEAARLANMSKLTFATQSSQQ